MTNIIFKCEHLYDQLSRLSPNFKSISNLTQSPSEGEGKLSKPNIRETLKKIEL